MSRVAPASDSRALPLLVALAAWALAACGDDGGAATDTADAAGTAADTTPMDGATDGATTAETTPDVVADTAPEVVATPLPALADALVFTPGEDLGDVAVQPALAWGAAAGGVGRLVVAWTGAAGEDLGIFVGAWDVDGDGAHVATAPALVHVARDGLRNEPAVCALADGGFVVVWSIDAPSEDGTNLHVAWRRLDADGAPLGAQETEHTTERPGNHWLAEVACRPASAGGGFVLAGVRPGPEADMGFEVFMQPFDAAGAPVGAALAAFARDAGGQGFPVVGVDGQGNLRVAWEDTPDTDAATVIATRTFAASGAGYTPGERLELVAGTGDDAMAPVLAVHPLSGHALAGGVLGTHLRVALDVGAGFAPLALPETPSTVTTASAAAAFGDDDFALVWFRGTGASVQVRHAEVAGGVMGDAVTVASGSFPLAYRPALARRDDVGAIAWTESLGGGRFAVRVAAFRVP